MVVVAQLGARMSYAVPRILYRRNMLARLFTDLYATPSVKLLFGLLPARLRPVLARKLLTRVAEEIPPNAVTPLWRFGLEYTVRLRAARSSSALTRVHLWAGRRFCELIRDDQLDGARAVYAYNGAALELLQRARQRRLLAILEQTIAPRTREDELVAARFPDWPETSEHGLAALDFQRREEREWEAADLIVCGSDFVRDEIRGCGGPAHKCVVVPYGVDDSFVTPLRRTRAGRLRVLTVGAVGFRKGSPYVLEAAKATRKFADFRMVGPWLLPESMRAKLATELELLGAIPRGELGQHYSWADVFLLPSICEGSATVTYEALRAGLPVICTPNTGSVVRHGVDGFIVPVGDVDGIVRVLECLDRDRELLARLQANTAARQDLSVEAYGERLIGVLAEYLAVAKDAHVCPGCSESGIPFVVPPLGGL